MKSSYTKFANAPEDVHLCHFGKFRETLVRLRRSANLAEVVLLLNWLLLQRRSVAEFCKVLQSRFPASLYVFATLWSIHWCRFAIRLKNVADLSLGRIATRNSLNT
jgi:hypothetical protein